MHIAQLKIELGKKEEAREHVLAAMDLCRIRIGVNDQSLFWHISPTNMYGKLRQLFHD